MATFLFWPLLWAWVLPLRSSRQVATRKIFPSKSPPVGCSKNVLKNTWKFRFGHIIYYLNFSLIRKTNHTAFSGKAWVFSAPEAKTHSVHWHSKWSFSASQTFQLYIALVALSLSSKSYHFSSWEFIQSPNVILITSIFKTFDLNINNYLAGKVQTWPMVYGH